MRSNTAKRINPVPSLDFVHAPAFTAQSHRMVGHMIRIADYVHVLLSQGSTIDEGDYVAADTEPSSNPQTSSTRCRDDATTTREADSTDRKALGTEACQLMARIQGAL